MIWKSHQLQIKHAKAGNAGNLFDAKALLESKALRRAWLIKTYKTEKTLAASKPVWFLSSKLCLKKGCTQRLM